MECLASIDVIQHTAAEYLGLLEDHFEGRKIRFNYHRPFTQGGKVPKKNSISDGLILLGGGPWGSSRVLAYYMYEKAFSEYGFRMGYGAAIAVVLLATNLYSFSGL